MPCLADRLLRQCNSAHLPTHPAFTIPDQPNESPPNRQRKTIETTRHIDASTAAALAQCPAPSPFHSVDWFQLLADHGIDGGEPLFGLIRPQDRSAALACLPLLQRHGGPRTLTALANFYSPIFGPIGPDHQASTIACELAHYAADTRPRWDIVDLHPLDPDTPFAQAALSKLRAAGFWADTYLCFGNWYEPIAKRDYAAYLADRPGQTRSNVARSLKRLQKAGNSELAIIKDTGPLLERAIEDFVTVYNASWKRPEPYPRFIPELCLLAAARGWLRLGIVRLAGKPVAAQIWLVCSETAYIYKLAYVEESARLGAGTYLSSELFRHALDTDRVQQIDYLVGDEPYKLEWMTRRRERRGIAAFNRHTLHGCLAAARHFGGKVIVAAARKPPSATPG